MTPTGEQISCPQCGLSVSFTPNRSCLACSARERIVEEAIPSLRVAIAQLLAGNGAHVFTVAQGTNSQTGVQSQLSCFVTQQHVAIVMEHVLAGMAKSQEFIMEQMKAAGAFGSVRQ